MTTSSAMACPTMYRRGDWMEPALAPRLEQEAWVVGARSPRRDEPAADQILFGSRKAVRSGQERAIPYA